MKLESRNLLFQGTAGKGSWARGATALSVGGRLSEEEEEALPSVCQGVWREGSLSAVAAVLPQGRGEGNVLWECSCTVTPSTRIFMWAARGRFSAATQNLFFFLLALLLNPVAETQSIECTQGLVKTVLCFPCASLAGIRLKMTRAQWKVRCKQL